MKVMCVFIGPIGEYEPGEKPIKIIVGGEYIVADVCNEPEGEYFELSHDLGFIYPSEFFATLPEQSADQINEQEHEAIIYAR